MKKRNSINQQNSAKRQGLASHPLLVAAFGAFLAAIFGFAVYFFQKLDAESEAEEALFGDDPHSYAFSMQGREISGQSSNPFEQAQGYFARVEICERHGVEDIFLIYSCHLTVKPTESLTLSNSENVTSAIYEDGSVATICCMYVDDSPSAPLYRIELPRGVVTRRTYGKGEEIHVRLDIPGADQGRELDAISFSPGEQAPPVLFPLRGNLQDRVFSTEFINSRKDDPRVQELVRKAHRMRDDLNSRREQNEGLTYPE